jgi:diguanylate cyclase (GGDEF)-like protein
MLSYLDETVREIARKISVPVEDHERDQATFRLFFSIFVMAWFSGLAFLPHESWADVRDLKMSIFVAGVYFIFACSIQAWVAMDSNHALERRIGAMLIEPVLIAGLIVTGGKAALPFAFGFAWVPIDHGMRYGSRYVVLGGLYSLLVFGCVMHYERYWGGMVELSVGLLLMLAVVIHYIAALMRRLNAAQDRLMARASIDPLTGLKNRRQFIEHMKRQMVATRRDGLYAACIFLDLDGFKSVNDQYGHATGDQLLIKVSRALGQCVRETDVIGRFGGDEFVIAADCLKVPDDALIVANRVLQKVAAIKTIDAHPVQISVSMGIAWYQSTDPGEDPDADALIHRADNAMYAAKRGGRNRVCVMHPDGRIE